MYNSSPFYWIIILLFSQIINLISLIKSIDPGYFVCCIEIVPYYIWKVHKHSAFHNNNNNNSLHLYSAFLGTQSALHWRGGGGGLLNYHQCAASTWMMRRQPYCARTPTTHQLTGGEETVMKPISVWGWLGGYDGQRPVGKFGQDAGLTPLLFFEGHPGIFYDHRESGPLFNVSSLFSIDVFSKKHSQIMSHCFSHPLWISLTPGMQRWGASCVCATQWKERERESQCHI